MYLALCCCVLPMMLNDGKNELIMLKFVPFESKYWMPLHATWIEFKFFKFNSNSWNVIWIPLNWMKIQLDPNSSSIEEKLYVNWCLRFLKSTCSYGLKKNPKKYFQMKDKFSNLFNLGIN